MPRKVKEWIGKTDDTMPPPSVRLRIFERDGGRCRLTGKKILAGDKWDLDHIIPLADGGENREAILHRFFTMHTSKRRRKRTKHAQKRNETRSNISA
ncbi:HNH endonuclease signature motif containing protein [Bartonella apihabitans]|nr:HNH endonuclease signature motif containing protein [Bartonella apihabitans]WLT07795.1 HNH endonuclease signature motif containing protein [Bartonella apihabitans]